MDKFPVYARKERVLRALRRLGFGIVREREHLSLERVNADGSKTPMTIPNHPNIKGGTLQAALRQSGVPKDEFLEVFETC